ncbi:uncharacterized protein LOC134287709 [Aedes albopictus]|uniref:Uncharacterized protein n=1 Tax=Aedes albopictus TaxID=7160 RepID=A0ABM1XNZ6_AEDAL
MATGADWQNCIACNKPDREENLVACDACKDRYHFSCASVDDGVRDRCWSCSRCASAILVDDVSRSGKSSKSGKSSRSLRIKLQLMKIEEERKAEEKLMLQRQELERERQEKALLEKASMEKRYREEKYALLMAEASEDDGESVKSRRSRVSSKDKVNRWIKDHAGILADGDGQPDPVVRELPAKPTDANADGAKNHETPLTSLGDKVGKPLGAVTKETVSIKPATQTSTPTQKDHVGPPESFLQMQTIAEQPNSKLVFDQPRQSISQPVVRGLTVPREIQQQVPMPTVWPPNHHSGSFPTEQQQLYPQIQNPAFGPRPDHQRAPAMNHSRPPPGFHHSTINPNQLNGTQSFQPDQSQAAWGQFQQQLAARQVVPKELPVFTGNPEDWPLFVSSYRNSTAMCGYSDAENLMRLQRCLRGSALEAVRSNLLLPSSVPQVLATLETLFGSPDRLLQTMLNKVRTVPAPKADRLETLVNFGITVQNLVGHLKGANQQAHLMNPSLLSELVEKLPANIRLDWALHKQRAGFVDLGTFSEYMMAITSAASDVTQFSDHDAYRANRIERQRPKEKAYMNTHSSADVRKSDSFRGKPESLARPCYICQSLKHRIRDCSRFKTLPMGDRWKAVSEHQLCKICLVPHGKWPCKSNKVCEVGGCSKGHNTLLHPGHPDEFPRSGTSAPAVVSVHRQLQNPILFRIIPVTLYGKGTQITTFAFLDEGSSLTLMDADIADQLNISGEVHPLCLTWTANIERREATSRQVSLQISGSSNDTKFVLGDVRTVEGLALPTQTLQYGELARRYPHLEGLPIKDYEQAVPRILIGMDNVHLSVPLRRRERGTREPIAAKTRLGWTVFGCVGDPSKVSVSPSFHICECVELNGIHQLVESFFSEECLGIVAARTLEGNEDRRAREILETTTVQREDGRFETGLLWRNDVVEFPPSYAMAERRLACLHRRLKANPELLANLETQIAEYQIKGYAHKATKQEIEEFNPKQTWFLPLGVVTNPRKPGKVRMIWDAAAKVNGVSFNSMMLKGPDLLTPLPKVLFQFRQRQIAVVGDVREMYHQFFIRDADRSAQCFLWSPEPSQPPEVFIMDAATFGSTCSPCQAQFIKNMNAKSWANEFPEAAVALVENHYVDDYLDSRDTAEEMAKVATDVRTVHAKARFEIRNWQSNSGQVLAHLGEQHTPQSKEFTSDKVSLIERVLGMAWLPKEDVFTFRISVSEDLQRLVSGDSVPTKRKILRFIMSLYDPIGLISHVLIHGKTIIQDLWRCGVGWDDPIPEEVNETWRRFVSVISELHQVQVPRCYFPDYENGIYETLELHMFVDASLSAMACAAFFRVIDRGQTRCALVASKAKVAPLKPLSVPRLELQAAVMGSRLMKTIADSHSIKIQRRFIWTDSNTVLLWIRSDARKYRQYVAVRVGEILDETNVQEWRYVPSGLNVADDATKWKGAPDLRPTNRWFSGPDFLYKPENQWPQQKVQYVEIPEELRAVHFHREIARVSFIDVQRFSKWERLLRSASFIFKFIRRCRNIPGSSQMSEGLDQQDFQRAECALWRLAQEDEYAEELKQIRVENESEVKRNSPLRKLSPFIGENGELRLGGRIGASPFTAYDAKYPVILPKGHRITELIIDSYHRLFGHQNGETVVNELRQKYYISNMRAEVRKAAKRCQWCRTYKVQPQIPRMAPLPVERVIPFVRPFTMIGIDYFGPYLIKIGRSLVKRWVVLYTCLTIRAVHLEIAASLSTESCMLALRRFIARRGAPQQIYTDNGTNFVGTERELARQLQDVNQKMSESFTNANTRWNFIPPASPHMGGAWERMVRAVKTAMSSMNHPRTPTEEVFQTVLCEAESMVNSRPLTYMPLEGSDQEALTPNHFLLLNSVGVTQTEKSSTEEREALRSNWKLCQHILDQFWRRWIREYLPTITRRTKWFAETKRIEIGDVVFIVDGNVRNRWTRGVVTAVFPGKDGRIRQAEVRTNSGTLRRSVAKLAVMDVLSEGKADERSSFTGPGMLE